MGLSIETMKPGDSARVTGLVAGDRGYRQRLLAMGLTPGAVLEVRRKAPLGDPIEISVRNFTLTLRKSEAAILELEAV
ncbi:MULTISPECIES: FeoA family protein [unclassified Pleomorphomonas]|uniref:FeoA family protein n=1 Tax=unclassified Pleomorphomonas TaxID=2627136 RepID=UPI002042C8DE|nr:MULTISPECIES: FeoA family protein [unclassified Pleomorphomonas]MCM5554554.1 ferrous iron transport protein A [Pleomorphomonas sp. NRK KF1]MCM5559571.1 ferrous iron transport protein A [Pleomorphomonas sp. JP5]